MKKKLADRLGTTHEPDTSAISKMHTNVITPIYNLRRRILLSAVFLLYVAISGYAICHHEPWTDEVRSWNIAKGSNTYADMIFNRRYEGHPLGWYTILWSISKFTHNTDYMKAAQWLLAVTVVFVILFRSPFPLRTRILIPFGYYFLFEYAILSRNYAIGILPALCICCILRKDFKYKTVLYYALLFCMSNTHLLAAILAGSLHIYYLLWNAENKRKVWPHVLAGILVFLPAVYFIFPPSDNQLNMHSWLSRWSIHQAAALQEEVPLRAFLPIPAWWDYHFWNTEFLLTAKKVYYPLKLIAPLLSVALIVLGGFILKKSKKSLALYIANVLVNAIVASFFQFEAAARYSGFIYIGFITAYWLYCYEFPIRSASLDGAPSARPRLFASPVWLVNLLLLVQLAAGAFAIYKDIRLPFSNIYRISEMAKEVPPNKRLVTDYWTMNGYVAFMDKPAYCIDAWKNMSFVTWGEDIPLLTSTPNRYSSGLKDLFSHQRTDSVYLVSQGNLQQLFKIDPQLPQSFHISVVDKMEGAIEKESNLYLYLIRP
jgi:hypothetical protein